MPEAIKDDILGSLILSRFDTWEAKINDIELSLDSLDSIARAHQVATGLEGFAKQAKAFAARELLELKNEVWSDGDEDANPIPITAEQFAQRMTLTSLNIASDKVSFWFDDGDLFFGHAILVELNEQDQWTEASFHG